jgi:hypothetical protein
MEISYYIPSSSQNFAQISIDNFLGTVYVKFTSTCLFYHALTTFITEKAIIDFQKNHEFI